MAKAAPVIALTGLVGPHQRLILAEQLQHIAELDARIGRISQEIEGRYSPFDELLGALDEIPGVGRRVAEDVLAEIGTDMSRFRTHKHLASWARLCPGNDISAGKSRSGRTGHGNKWLRSALTEAAKAAGRTKHSYLASQYHQLGRRIGKNRASIAVAHSILTIIYFMIRDRVPYKDLGPTFLDERGRTAVKRRLVQRLENLDFQVQIRDRRVA